MRQRIHSAAQHRRLRSPAQGQVQDLGQQDASKLLVAAAQHNHPRTQQQSSLQGKLESATLTLRSARSFLSTIMAELLK